MLKRILGKTNMELTELGFGAMELKNSSTRDAEIILNSVLDSGINFIDTSPDYGLAEEHIGNTIAHRRTEYILATKCCCNIFDNTKPNHIFTVEQIVKNLDHSLKLLKTDYIDIWQLHTIMPDDLPDGENSELLNKMLEIKKSGKVRSIGYSPKNANADHPLYPDKFCFECFKVLGNYKCFDMVQLVYGALTRGNEKCLEKVYNNSQGVVVRGVLKKYFDNYDQLFNNAKLNELLQQNESRQSFLIRFALANKSITSMIIGSKNISHINDNVLYATNGALPSEVYIEAKKRLDSIGVTYNKL